MTQFLYHIASPEEDRELAYLEAKVLLEENVLTPFHFSSQPHDISESAYIKLCGKVLLTAKDFSSLIQQILLADYPYDGFRIELHESIRTRKDLDSHNQAIISIADALKNGNPNLNEPKVYLDVVADETVYYFLERFSFNKYSWRKHIKKPYSFSSSVGARHSRALVNIACKNSKSFLDPCCGFGSVLVEAAYLGLSLMGNDINKKQVWYAEQNLAYFGHPLHITQQDALELLPNTKVDALVIDFPYGLNCQTTDTFYEDFLRYYRTRTNRLVSLTPNSITQELKKLNYQVQQEAVIRKGYKFKRYITLATTNPSAY